MPAPLQTLRAEIRDPGMASRPRDNGLANLDWTFYKLTRQISLMLTGREAVGAQSLEKPWPRMHLTRILPWTIMSL